MSVHPENSNFMHVDRHGYLFFISIHSENTNFAFLDDMQDYFHKTIHKACQILELTTNSHNSRNSIHIS